MRSLFLRLFVAFWLAMMLIGAALAVIPALNMNDLRMERFKRIFGEAVRSAGERVVACLERGATGDEDGVSCDDEAQRLPDVTLTVFRDGELVYGSAPAGDVAELVAAIAAGGDDERRKDDDLDLYGAAIERADGVRYVVVGTRPRSSRWLRMLAPETLPQRLVVLTLITGLVSWALARYLSRPLRTLRRATRRLAGGDLSVRVAPELVRSDGETRALAEDFDGMAEQLETLLSAQRRLLRDVSHELRSPLARLRVALELARQHAAPEGARALDRMERETERLDDLLRQVLTISRLEAGAPLPEGEIVDLGALLTEIAEDVDFEARGQDRRVEIGAIEAVPVLGSEEVLRSAIENVLRNAVRFTRDGSAVEVSLGRLGARAVLDIRDHGPGVPEDALEDIFLPFVRVGADRDRKTGGIGLGLAIAQRSVGLHGGRVVAENAPGGGLLVRIELSVAADG
jgi:two-component system, OmpR family, sensor kinase